MNSPAKAFLKFSILLLLLNGLCLTGLSQNLTGERRPLKQGDSQSDSRLFPLGDVKPGQTGTGWTVFSGSTPESFGVEVLGVVPGFPAPRQSTIIARLSGDRIAKTGVFAGMSGSPVYINGRLVGAVAFSFPFSKEPIAGITPIGEMIDIFEDGKAPAHKTGPHPVSFAQLASTGWKPEWNGPPDTSARFIAGLSDGHLASVSGQQLAPIATPIVFSGISAQALSTFAPQLEASGLLPVSGAGGAAAITPLAKVTDNTLAPGTSVSVQLVRGDFSIAAAGTVTFRDFNHIYAFGHPFLGLGQADMPMSEAPVVTVIPNLNNSFKLAVPGQMVGAISQDRATGVYGKLGQAPKMIPVTINLHTSRDKTEKYSYEIASDQFLTPLLLNLTVFSTISSTEKSLGDSTISVSGQIEVEGQQPVQIERRFSSISAGVMAAGSVAAPVAALMASGFDDVQLGPITLDIASTDARMEATLDRIAIDRTEVARGETLEIMAYIRANSGRSYMERIPVKIPDDIPLGQLILFVGDGSILQQASATQSFVPKDLGQLVSAINKIKKNDRLYVKLFRATPGAVIGTSELPNLPPSVLATLSSDRTSGGYLETVLSPVFEKELLPADYVVAGQQMMGIDVVR